MSEWVAWAFAEALLKMNVLNILGFLKILHISLIILLKELVKMLVLFVILLNPVLLIVYLLIYPSVSVMKKELFIKYIYILCPSSLMYQAFVILVILLLSIIL